MESLPSTLVDSLPPSLVPEAESWWQSLGPQDRGEVSRLCDGRKDLFLFETFSEGEDKPRVTGGKFIPHDDAFGLGEWGEDYFQHLLDHPELMIVFEPERREFRIGCSRHVAARRCFVDGEIDASFQCPFKSDRCLMRDILAERHSVKLRPLSARIEGDSFFHAPRRRFKSEFMAHIVLPGGGTVGELMKPQIEQAYLSGDAPSGIVGLLGVQEACHDA